MAVISGTDYYTIATEYANAYEKQVSVIAYYYAALEALKCLDDIDVTIALLGDFYTAYTSASSRLTSTQGFEAAVQALQSHVARESGMTVAAWIQEEIMDAGINSAGIPNAFAIISKAVGYDIDSKIDHTTESSSNSSSS